jgi:serine/threonine protein kinase
VAELSEKQDVWIRRQVQQFTGRELSGPLTVFDDTSNFMGIDRDHIVDLGGQLYLIKGNEREGRFTLQDQPKFWVKRALALDTGRRLVLKMVFLEEFSLRIGALQMKCVRSAEKESRVLDRVRGHPGFMQGHAARDARGNLVRVIDFIDGPNLLAHMSSLAMSHERYFATQFPAILAETIAAIEAIRFLHQAHLCHGDIRNDHIILDDVSGRFRWIDFDLDQAFPDYDVWCIGNILHCIVAKGFCTFYEILRERPELAGRLDQDDASMLLPHRVMNLGKIYPYLPRKLSAVLARFSAGTQIYYGNVGQILDDLGDCAASQGWPIAPHLLC